jgi:hypothetical protein
MKLFHSIKRRAANPFKGLKRQSINIATTEQQSPQPDMIAEPVHHDLPSDDPASGITIDGIIRVERVNNAEFYVGDLFRRKFGCDPPDYPIHFVAFYRFAPGELQTVGYVHYLAFEDSYLCGGLVIDDRLYRRMKREHRVALKAAGGISELLLRSAMIELADAPAIWGYVGDLLSEKVNIRVGLRRTAHQYLMVHWSKPLAPEEKDRRLSRVAALGPF